MLRRRQQGEPFSFTAGEFNTLAAAADDARTVADRYQDPAVADPPYHHVMAVNVSKKNINEFEPVMITGVWQNIASELGQDITPPGLSIFKNISEMNDTLINNGPGQAPAKDNWYTGKNEADIAGRQGDLITWSRFPIILVEPYNKIDWSGQTTLTGTNQPKPANEPHNPEGIDYLRRAFGVAAEPIAGNPGGKNEPRNYSIGKVCLSGITPCRIAGEPSGQRPPEGSLSTDRRAGETVEANTPFRFATPTGHDYLATSPAGAAEILADPHAFDAFKPTTAPAWPNDEEPPEGEADTRAGRIGLVRLGQQPAKQIVYFRLFTDKENVHDDLAPYQFDPWDNRDRYGRAKAWLIEREQNEQPTPGIDLSAQTGAMRPTGLCGVVDIYNLFGLAFPGAVGYGIIDPEFTYMKWCRYDGRVNQYRHEAPAPVTKQSDQSRSTEFYLPTIVPIAIQQYCTRGWGWLNVSGRKILKNDGSEADASKGRLVTAQTVDVAGFDEVSPHHCPPPLRTWSLEKTEHFNDQEMNLDHVSFHEKVVHDSGFATDGTRRRAVRCVFEFAPTIKDYSRTNLDIAKQHYAAVAAGLDPRPEGSKMGWEPKGFGPQYKETAWFAPRHLEQTAPLTGAPIDYLGGNRPRIPNILQAKHWRVYSHGLFSTMRSADYEHASHLDYEGKDHSHHTH